MPVENLQITPVMEWLLGPGWYAGLLWQPLGIALLLAVVLGGGLALLLALRRSSAAPGPLVSDWLGGIFGAVSLLVLAFVALCSTAKTRDFLAADVATPLTLALAPLLGSDWSSGALYTWLGVAVGLTGVIYACCWLAAVLVGGPALGTRQCGRVMAEIAIDTARISPRRVFALAWLAFRDSVRRRHVYYSAFPVFLSFVLLAGLVPALTRSLHPGRLHIETVQNLAIFLAMIYMLVLSALSLPADIRDRTLHTVVTKPVRKLEIVLGRVLGLVFVGTVLLFGIGLISYVFTVRSLNHTHELTADKLQHVESLPGNGGTLRQGKTSRSHGHEHEVTIVERPGELPVATVEAQRDHTHALYVSGSGDKAVYTLGPPEGELQARVPIYGKLAFLDDSGGKKEKGINVGDEWTYRSFIRGQTLATAIWTFDGIREERFPESQFPNGIPVEMTIEVFRTHKGDQERGVAGSITLVNPDPRAQKRSDIRVTLPTFRAEKFATDAHLIPRSFITKGSDGRAELVDLFHTVRPGEEERPYLVSDDGRLEIRLQCLEPNQYFGMAQADLYIRAADGWFAWNFFKGYLGIWLQMVLVVALGVFFSTFLGGPVALLATLFLIIAGIFSSHVVELAGGKMVGGGPFEAFDRIIRQDNMISVPEPGWKTDIERGMDQATAIVMRYFSAMVPNVSDNDFVDHVAYGFNVGPDLLWRCLLCEAAYLLPVILLGYLALKQREMAQ